jgi:hypothetical protein
MSSYVLSPTSAADAYRLGEVQQAAFVDDPLTLAATKNIPKEAYIRWIEHAITHPDPPPGHKIQYMCAREAETGEIGGWAEWIIPLDEGEEWVGPAAEKGALPEGINGPVWEDYFKSLERNKARIMGDRKRWCACHLASLPILYLPSRLHSAHVPRHTSRLPETWPRQATGL